MIFSWLKRRRRSRLLKAPWPDEWEQALKRHFQSWRRLSEADRAELRKITTILVAEKTWEGCMGVTVTDAMKVTIAAQAGLLLLGLSRHDYYHNVDTVLIYPDSYVLRQGADPMGLLGETDVPVLGHAQYGGPIVLSWKSARRGGADGDDGRNLVFHEFAHKLDMLDGLVDGTPPLAHRRHYAQWHRVMTAEYQALRRRTQSRRGRKRSLLRAYGATDVAEFFAVATEVFFEKPDGLRRRHPALFSVLQDFYNQDPTTWGP